MIILETLTDVKHLATVKHIKWSTISSTLIYSHVSSVNPQCQVTQDQVSTLLTLPSLF